MAEIIGTPDNIGDSKITPVTGTTSLSKRGLDVNIVAGPALATILDEAVAGTTYIGSAAAGSAQGSAVWRIKKMVEAAGITTITYADGDTQFDNIWTNRASLTYS